MSAEMSDTESLVHATYAVQQAVDELTEQVGGIAKALEDMLDVRACKPTYEYKFAQWGPLTEQGMNQLAAEGWQLQGIVQGLASSHQIDYEPFLILIRERVREVGSR